MRSPLLILLFLTTVTSSVKYIVPNTKQRVIVYSHSNQNGNWIYREAQLSPGYYFSAIDDGRHEAYPGRRDDYVNLSALVAPAKDLTRFAHPIASMAKVLFTDEKGCVSRPCLFRRGYVVRGLSGNYYEIQATACRQIGRPSGRGDRLVSHTAVESLTFTRHVEQILSYSEDEKLAWREKICRDDEYADKTRTYEVAVRLESTDFNGCSKYKLIRASFVPKIQFTIVENPGEPKRQPEYMRLPEELNEIALDSGGDITHQDLTNTSKVLVQDRVYHDHWKLGTPLLRGRTIAIKLVQNHGLHETYYEDWNNVRQVLRPMKYLVAPLCENHNSTATTPTREPTQETSSNKVIVITATTPTREPTPETSSNKVIVITAIVACVVLLSLLGLAYLFFAIRRHNKIRERNRLHVMMRARQSSHGVRDTSFNVDPNRSMESAPPLDNGSVHYDVPIGAQNDANLYTEVINDDQAPPAYADVTSTVRKNAFHPNDYDKLKRNDVSTIKSSNIHNSNYDKPGTAENPEPLYFEYEDTTANRRYDDSQESFLAYTSLK